jgi:hypothetical protein
VPMGLGRPDRRHGAVDVVVGGLNAAVYGGSS